MSSEHIVSSNVPDRSAGTLGAPTADIAGEMENSAIISTAALEQDPFATNHLLKNLKARVVSGGFVTVAAQTIRFALYLLSIIILARLLTPADFGLVAMVGALASFLRLFRDGGLSTATVQRENITQAQVSNLFWINTGLGAIAALILACLAPAVGWFYGDSRLIGISLVLSITFLFSGASVQFIALLNRQMRFTSLASVDLGSLAFGVGVGIVMALCGCGYWSLVGSQLATSIAEFGVAWFACRWRPDPPRRGSGTKALLNFGVSLTASTLLRRLSDATDTLLLGRFFGAVAVGLYSRAMALLARPMDQFIGPFDAVFIPLLSRLQAQPDRYRSTFLRAYNAIAMLSFPLAGMLLALSKPIVFLLLGRDWSAVIPIFAAFTVAALFIPLSYAAMWLPVTQGRTKDILIAGIAFSMITITAVVVGLAFGAVGVALAYSLSGLLVRLPVQYCIVGRAGPVATRHLWGVFFKHLILYVVALCATALVQTSVVSLTPLAQLCICVPVGLCATSVIVLILPFHRRLALAAVSELRGVLQRRTVAAMP